MRDAIIHQKYTCDLKSGRRLLHWGSFPSMVLLLFTSFCSIIALILALDHLDTVDDFQNLNLESSSAVPVTTEPPALLHLERQVSVWYTTWRAVFSRSDPIHIFLIHIQHQQRLGSNILSLQLSPQHQELPNPLGPPVPGGTDKCLVSCLESSVL